MMLARFLSKLFKKEGIILVDSEGQKYICGEISGNDKDIAVLQKQIELLEVQIEEIKVSTSNPLSN